MPLTQQQIEILADAINNYDFPKRTYNFQSGKEVSHPSMRQLETSIRDKLTSCDAIDVEDGLSNILYWGYYRIGYRDVRVNKFRSKVKKQQLIHASKVFQNLSGPGIRIIKNLNLPEFSGISFISKVRMFLDPHQYAILDQKLMRLAKFEPVTLFYHIKVYPTSIPCTINNERVYQNWCDICSKASELYFQEQEFIAVDIERGIFHLIENGQEKIAANIIANF